MTRLVWLVSGALLMCSACWTAAPKPVAVAVRPKAKLQPAKVVEAPRELPRAQTVLADMAAVYAAAQTYTDPGTAAGTRSSARFETAFARPLVYRYEVAAGGVDLPSFDGAREQRTSVLWTVGADVYLAQPFELARAMPSFRAGANAARGLDGFVNLVPHMLLPTATDGPNVTALIDPSVAGEDTLDGHPCWQIVGGLGAHLVVTLSVDEATHALRRAAFVTRKEPPVVVDYAPVFDASLDATTFAGPDIAVEQPLRPMDRWIGITFNMVGTILSVMPASPALKAGLAPGDTITAFDGHEFSQMRDVMQHIRTTPIGTAIQFSVDRGGVTKQIAVVVATVPAVTAKASTAAPAAPPPPPKPVGPPPQQPAPAFDVEVLAGSPDAHARLADLAGHVVVVDFWATWCNPCKMAMPGLVALQAAHAAAGLRVIGVSNEDTDDIRDFLSTHPLGYTVAHDGTGAAWTAYGVSPIPMLVVIDKAGKLEQTFLGAGHEAEIEALVTRLLQQP